MSKETKEKVREVKREFTFIKEAAGQYVEQTKPFDRELSRKIQEVQRTSEEVVKHITERQSD